MKKIKRGLLCFSCLICLSSCNGVSSIWGSHYGLAYTKEGHYSLKDEKKSVHGHVFDKPVFAYAVEEWYLGRFKYEERHYDYMCRCGYRMSYDSLIFEEKEDGMSLTSSKVRGMTGYDLSHTIKESSGVAYKIVNLPYLYPSVYDGKEVVSIEENAFYDEKAKESYEYQGDENAFPNLTTIKSRAFYKSSVSFPSLYFPKVSRIGYRAFEDSEVKSLTFGESLADFSFANQPFAYSSATERVDLSKCQLESIPNLCFYQCTGLKSVFLPDTLKTIEQGAFLDCGMLKEMVVPSSLETKITSDLFSDYYNQILPVERFFYKGSAEQAKAIFSSKLESRVYLYSEENPIEEGRYWHYVDGEPTIYESEGGQA